MGCNDPHVFYRDGYCGGGELPSDLESDEMVYPERAVPSPMVPMNLNESFDEYERRCLEQAQADEQARYFRDRDFAITEGDVTGQAPGPPRTIK